MLRYPLILVRNLLVFLYFLWSTVWFKIGYLFRRKKKLYITADLEPRYKFGPPAGMAAYFQETPTFLELRETFERIARTDEIDGMVVSSDGLSMGMARTEGLASLFDRVRASGTHVVTHLLTPTTGEYLLASAADEVLVTPSGRLQTFGPRFDQYFGADALDRLGIRPQLLHIGDFKTASHRLIHREMTPAQEAMMESLHDSMTTHIRGRIAERRGLAPSEAAELFRRAPLDAETARELGFVDHAVFRGRLDAWLQFGDAIAPAMRPAFEVPAEFPEAPPADEPAPPEEPPEQQPGADDAEVEQPEDERQVMTVSLEEADAVLPPRLDWKPIVDPAPRFAVMDLTGMIVMPDMPLPGQNSPTIDPESVTPKLREIRESGRYSGLMLHINSPGGSALASDIIWEAIQRVRASMPVVAYCTDVAGSGGYYLSVAADEIVMHESTLTGSIGVVNGTFSAEELVDRLGVNVESIYEAEADTFTSLVHPLSERMMDRLDEQARQFYRRFLERVGQNRGLPKRRLHRYARGRVYLGEQAHRRGLLDRLGDYDEAVAALGELADLDPETVETDFVAHREPNIRQLLGVSGQARSVVPDQLVEPLLAARMLEHEQMLALMDLECDLGSGNDLTERVATATSNPTVTL